MRSTGRIDLDDDLATALEHMLAVVLSQNITRHHSLPWLNGLIVRQFWNRRKPIRHLVTTILCTAYESLVWTNAAKPEWRVYWRRRPHKSSSFIPSIPSAAKVASKRVAGAVARASLFVIDASVSFRLCDSRRLASSP